MGRRRRHECTCGVSEAVRLSLTGKPLLPFGLYCKGIIALIAACNAAGCRQGSFSI